MVNECFGYLTITGFDGIRIITKISESIEDIIAGIDQRFAKININYGILKREGVKIVHGPLVHGPWTVT